MLALLGLVAMPLRAQTISDGVMMGRKLACIGVMYGHDSWDQYWEGNLKRGNGNIGTVTTQSVMWGGDFGVTDRFNLIAIVPYIRTQASAGVLRGMSGIQDLTVAAKYMVVSVPFTKKGALRAIVVGAASVPLADYTPDYLPLSIGLASRQFAARFTLDFEAEDPWFITGSMAHTWRHKVSLDRPAYYTDGHLYLSDEVRMPRVYEYEASAGFRDDRILIPITFIHQKTLGGGDIRRQDMPFVSNRMDFSKIDAYVLYYFELPQHVGVKLGATYTLNGRNVGQATTGNGALFYVFHF